MPLQVVVNIAKQRPGEGALRVALKKLEPECPPGEHWFVTVIGGPGSGDPVVSVFRAFDSGTRSVPPVEGWVYRLEGGHARLKRPLYWKPVPCFARISSEQWTAEVAEHVRTLLRELCQPGRRGGEA
jgi:hypothetical protein